MPVVQLPSVSSTSRGHAQHARRQTTLWTRADRDFPSACAREERRRTRTWTRRRWYHRSAVVSIPPRRTSSRCPSAASSQHPRHEPFASNVGSSATREFLLFVRSDRRSRSSPGQTDRSEPQSVLAAAAPAVETPLPARSRQDGHGVPETVHYLTLHQTSDDDGGRSATAASARHVGAFPAVWCGFLLVSRHREDTGRRARSRKAPRRFWRHAVSIARHEFERRRRWSHSFPLAVNRRMSPVGSVLTQS